MQIKKAVVTAAGRKQRTLPLQTLIDRDGAEKSVLGIIIEEILRANVEEICIVVRPGDESTYAEVASGHAGQRGGVTLSQALAELVRREQYLALKKSDWRYDVGARYGLLTAQLALALNDKDRDEVLSKLLELLAQRKTGAVGR